MTTITAVAIALLAVAVVALSLWVWLTAKVVISHCDCILDIYRRLNQRKQD
jgi:hypothetical protein